MRVSRPVLRVATWNVYLGADLSVLFGARSARDLEDRAEAVLAQLARTDQPGRVASLSRVLAREAPDVVGLQEVCRWRRTDPDPAAAEEVVDVLPELLAALQAAGAGYDVHAAGVSFEGALSVAGAGVQVTGRHLLLVRRDAPVTVTADRTGEFAAAAQIPTGVPGLRFPVRRGWGLLDLRVAGRPVRVVHAHTEAWDDPVREAQLAELLEVAGDAEVAVVLGDLNAEPDALAVAAPWVDAWPAAGGGPGAGRTAGRDGDLLEPQLVRRIDYVLARGALVRGCRLAGVDPADRTPSGRWPSDHAMVVADLAV